MTPQLREYQKHQVTSARRELGLGNDTLIVAATGTGKTTSVAEIVRLVVEEGWRVLVLAHRRELLDQLFERCRLFGLSPAYELGKKRAGNARVVVSSVQTMANRLDRFSSKDFQLVVVDEAHHAPSPGYRLILDYFQAGGARVLGVTATPDRLDQVPLGTIFESVASEYDIVQAIEDGWLVPAKGIRIEVEGFDLSSVRQKVMDVHTPEEGWGDLGALHPGEVVDLHPGDLGRAAIRPEAVEGVVAPLLELAENKRTYVFAVNVAHAHALVDAINARRPGAARAVHADHKKFRMHRSERKQNLLDHKAGEFQFLVNVSVLTEGYDDPKVECVAMIRPTQSRVFYAQACGRGLRPCKEIDKKFCLVLDFVGVSCEHDLVGPEDALAGAMIGEVEDFKNPEEPEPQWPVFVDESEPESLDDLMAHVGIAPQPRQESRHVVDPADNPHVAKPNPAKSGHYRPTGMVARFTTAVVELIRGVARKLVDHKSSAVSRLWERAKKKWDDLGND